MKRSRLARHLISEHVALTLVCFAAVGAVVYYAAQTTLQQHFKERLVMVAALKAATVEQRLSGIRHEAAVMIGLDHSMQYLQEHFATRAKLIDLKVVSPFPADLAVSDAAIQVQDTTWWLPLPEYDLAIAIPDTLINTWLAEPTGLGLGATAFLAEPACTGICRTQYAGEPHWMYRGEIATAPFVVALPVVFAPVRALMLAWLACSTGLAVVCLGFVIYRSRQLTRPLNDLARIAQATQLAIELDQPLPHFEPPATAQVDVMTLALAFEALIQEIRQFRQHNATTQGSLATEIELRTAALSEAARLSQGLKVIIEKVRATLDEELILETVIVAINQALQPLVCNVALYDSSRQQATVVHERGSVASGCLNRHLSMKDDIYRYLLSGQSVQFCPLDTEGYGQVVTKLAVPIVDGTQVLGDLWVTRSANLTFLPNEQSLVSQVAAQCAIAIRQARLYRAAQDQVAVLERLNQLKDDFLSTVSHELRTPLTRLKMALRMLALSPEKFERYHPLAMAACNQQIDLVDDLLSLQDLAAGCYTSTAAQVDLVNFIESIVQHYEALLAEQHHRLHLSIQPIAICLEPKPVRRIIGELIHNALKYSPPESEIAVQCFAQGDHWVCTVQNPGHIPEAERERIFEKFYRIPRSDPWQHGGTGLGLALVQQLAQYLEGEVDVCSDGEFVTVTLSLPYVRISSRC